MCIVSVFDLHFVLLSLGGTVALDRLAHGARGRANGKGPNQPDRENGGYGDIYYVRFTRRPGVQIAVARASTCSRAVDVRTAPR